MTTFNDGSQAQVNMMIMQGTGNVITSPYFTLDSGDPTQFSTFYPLYRDGLGVGGMVWGQVDDDARLPASRPGTFGSVDPDCDWLRFCVGWA